MDANEIALLMDGRKVVRADQLQRGDVITRVQYGDSPGEWAPPNRVGERVTKVEAVDDGEGHRPSVYVTVNWNPRYCYPFRPDDPVEIKDK